MKIFITTIYHNWVMAQAITASGKIFVEFATTNKEALRQLLIAIIKNK